MLSTYRVPDIPYVMAHPITDMLHDTTNYRYAIWNDIANNRMVYHITNNRMVYHIINNRMVYHITNNRMVYHITNNRMVYHIINNRMVYHITNNRMIYHITNNRMVYHITNNRMVYHIINNRMVYHITNNRMVYHIINNRMVYHISCHHVFNSPLACTSYNYLFKKKRMTNSSQITGWHLSCVSCANLVATPMTLNKWLYWQDTLCMSLVNECTGKMRYACHKSFVKLLVPLLVIFPIIAIYTL